MQLVSKPIITNIVIKALAVIIILILSLLVVRRVILRRGATSQVTPTPQTTRPSKFSPTPQTKSTTNPFGVMISGDSSQIKAQTAVKLGAKYYRPLSIFVDKWSGSCAECDAAVSAGLKLILTVRNNGGTPGVPTTPPTDLNAYKQTLGQIVDKYKPEVLVIENEENSGAIFYSGTPQQYLAELKAGCEVAHQKGIKCTNGGLVSSLVVAMVASQSNNPTQYLQKALVGAKADLASQINSPAAQKQISKGKELVTGYKAAGADFVNFHWYVADPSTISEAVNYLRSTSGLPVITNEVGQQANSDPAQVTNVMSELSKQGLPYIVWFSMDTNPPNGARALNDTNGSLRPNGTAYASFISSNY